MRAPVSTGSRPRLHARAAFAAQICAPAGVDPDKLIDGWLRKQKKADLQQIVREFLAEEPSVVRSRIMAGIRDGRETAGWPVVEVGMTFGELWAAAA